MRPLAISAQTIRAILFASTARTSIGGFLWHDLAKPAGVARSD